MCVCVCKRMRERVVRWPEFPFDPGKSAAYGRFLSKYLNGSNVGRGRVGGGGGFGDKEVGQMGEKKEAETFKDKKEL